MNFILFGKIGAGKDTVAEILSSETGAVVKKLGFKIRSSVDSYAGAIGEKPKRSHYQHYGESMRELFGAHLWNKVLFKEICQTVQPKQRIVIADARQPHEYSFWTSKGYFPIYVDVDDAVRAQRIKKRGDIISNHDLDHPTEKVAKSMKLKIQSLHPLSGYVLNNSDTLEKTREEVRLMLGEITKGERRT